MASYLYVPRVLPIEHLISIIDTAVSDNWEIAGRDTQLMYRYVAEAILAAGYSPPPPELPRCAICGDPLKLCPDTPSPVYHHTTGGHDHDASTWIRYDY